MRSIAATAGVALVGASVIAVTPVAPPPPEIRVASPEVRLAAASLLNVPANLLIDLVNIPYNEVQAINYTGKSLIYSGPWFVVGATNIWGVDPGDPGHFMSIVNMAVPFPALSGMALGEFDQNGLGQQLWYFVAAQLPVSQYCDDDGCLPTTRMSPITGIPAVDYLLWNVAIFSGQVKFPLFDNFFKVPLSDLTSGYTFGPDYPGYADPAGPVYDGLGFKGTTVGPNGENVMPWAGTTFTLDLSKPFQNYFAHLMADPSTNPIQLPDLVQLGRALQTLAAGLVIAFDPITPGSAFCPGDCSYLPAALDYPGIVKIISDAWPGNPLLEGEGDPLVEGDEGWLTAYENHTANVPTQEQIDRAVKLKEGGFWDFGNPSPPAEWSTGFNLSTLAPFFHKLWTDLGLNPPPLNPPAPAQEPDRPVNELRASEKVSQRTLPPSMKPNLVTVNLDAAPAATDSQVTKDVSNQAQQDVQSITPTATETPADAAAVPDNTDTEAGQTPATDTTRDGNMAVPGKVGGNGTKPRGELRSALRSAADQISSSISKVTGGLKGGTKTGETSTRGTKAGESDTGDTKAGESGTGGTNSDNAGTGGGHRAD